MNCNTTFPRTDIANPYIPTIPTSTQVHHVLHNVVYLYSHIEHKELISNPTIATL